VRKATNLKLLKIKEEKIMITNSKEETRTTSVQNTKRIAIMAVFIALSAVGALIKIPSPVGTVALDSAPGFFSALAFGGVEGSIVIALGHLLTSAVVGFPLGIPMHLIIAAEMALFALVYRFVNNKIGLIPAVIVASLLNGVVGAFTVFPVLGMGAVIGLLPFLLLGSVINVVVSALAYKALKESRLI
jgi:riboflavin transporter